MARPFSKSDKEKTKDSGDASSSQTQQTVIKRGRGRPRKVENSLAANQHIQTKEIRIKIRRLKTVEAASKRPYVKKDTKFWNNVIRKRYNRKFAGGNKSEQSYSRLREEEKPSRAKNKDKSYMPKLKRRTYNKKDASSSKMKNKVESKTKGSGAGAKKIKGQTHRKRSYTKLNETAKTQRKFSLENSKKLIAKKYAKLAVKSRLKSLRSQKPKESKGDILGHLSVKTLRSHTTSNSSTGSTPPLKTKRKPRAIPFSKPKIKDEDIFFSLETSNPVVEMDYDGLMPSNCLPLSREKQLSLRGCNPEHRCCQRRAMETFDNCTQWEDPDELYKILSLASKSVEDSKLNIKATSSNVQLQGQSTSSGLISFQSHDQIGQRNNQVFPLTQQLAVQGLPNSALQIVSSPHQNMQIMSKQVADYRQAQIHLQPQGMLVQGLDAEFQAIANNASTGGPKKLSKRGRPRGRKSVLNTDNKSHTISSAYVGPVFVNPTSESWQGIDLGDSTVHLESPSVNLTPNSISNSSNNFSSQLNPAQSNLQTSPVAAQSNLQASNLLYHQFPPDLLDDSESIQNDLGLDFEIADSNPGSPDFQDDEVTTSCLQEPQSNYPAGSQESSSLIQADFTRIERSAPQIVETIVMGNPAPTMETLCKDNPAEVPETTSIGDQAQVICGNDLAQVIQAFSRVNPAPVVQTVSRENLTQVVETLARGSPIQGFETVSGSNQIAETNRPTQSNVSLNQDSHHISHPSNQGPGKQSAYRESPTTSAILAGQNRSNLPQTISLQPQTISLQIPFQANSSQIPVQSNSFPVLLQPLNTAQPVPKVALQVPHHQISKSSYIAHGPEAGQGSVTGTQPLLVKTPSGKIVTLHVGKMNDVVFQNHVSSTSQSLNRSSTSSEHISSEGQKPNSS